MSAAGARDVEVLAAVRDLDVVARYRAKVLVVDGDCWWWRGAISGKGHGRFWVQAGLVVIAHRFGWALAHPDALALPELLAHRCDNPLCQNPDHLRESDPATNRREWAWRRHQLAGPLRDTRGARGRANELRDAVRDGCDLDEISRAGTRPVDEGQAQLW